MYALRFTLWLWVHLLLPDFHWHNMGLIGFTRQFRWRIRLIMEARLSFTGTSGILRADLAQIMRLTAIC